MDDPFAAAEADLPASTWTGIDNGAEVLAVTRHPVYGATYRRRPWMTMYPWTAKVRDAVAVFRGPDTTAPLIGQGRVLQLRRNGAQVRRIGVGWGGEDERFNDEPEFELILDRHVAVEVGDSIAFGVGYTPAQDVNEEHGQAGLRPSQAHAPV
ncbi:hypothetical protein [Micromonospora avicenniae]|uniref:hypothetical protein n=1 Tax=Micromonospora avicenniae TaxID=1198245 RepID=UPI00332BB52D